MLPARSTAHDRRYQAAAQAFGRAERAKTPPSEPPEGDRKSGALGQQFRTSAADNSRCRTRLIPFDSDSLPARPAPRSILVARATQQQRHSSLGATERLGAAGGPRPSK